MQGERNLVDVVSLSGVQQSVAVGEQNSGQFAARLRKAAKERGKWARKAGVSSYRIYCADLPDYALAVDLFTDTSGSHFVRAEEFPAPARIDADRADVRFADACTLIPAVLDVDSAHVVCVPRGDGAARSQEPLIVQIPENGLLFETNLSAHRDTGLPLDHRATRELLRSLAEGRRFLSLGSYAGAPAVYAAAGGAKGVSNWMPALCKQRGIPAKMSRRAPSRTISSACPRLTAAGSSRNPEPGSLGGVSPGRRKPAV